MSFTNLYYKRTAGTPKACYVCYKPTPTVLATANAVDFIYTCDAHLKDPGFATQLGDSGDGVSPGGAKKMGLSPEEIAKVKEEWEEKQRRKKEKAEKAKAEKEAAAKDGEKKDEDKESAGKDKKSKSPSPMPKTPGSLPASPSGSGTPTPSHDRYALHRDLFAMRLNEHRKQRQSKQMRELAPKLPGAPRGLPSS
ncbi:DUF1742-domain-containing protein [Dentipellis sp. KUC8613]|nr:DUF1742-domain-containing protein [Dentipellis sp. KUC8613]